MGGGTLKNENCFCFIKKNRKAGILIRSFLGFFCLSGLSPDPTRSKRTSEYDQILFTVFWSNLRLCGYYVHSHQAFFSRETSRELKMCMLEIVLTKVVLQKDYNSHNTPLFETGCDFGPPPTPHSDLAWSQQNWRSEISGFADFGAPIARRGGTLGDHPARLGCSPGPIGHPRHNSFQIEVPCGIEKRS